MQALDVHAFVRSKELLIFHKTKVDILVSGAVVSQGFHIMMECYELIADCPMPSGYPRLSILEKLLKESGRISTQGLSLQYFTCSVLRCKLPTVVVS